MAISKEQIVQAAITILNRDGIDRLTTRELAKELDIKSASLYWHFKGKQELYGAIAEYLCLQFDLPEETSDTQKYLEKALQAYRAMLLTVRDSSKVFENAIPDTPRRVELIHTISVKLLELGVKKENLMTVSNMVNNYVLSFTADEMRFKNTPPETLQTFMDMLDPEKTLTFMSQRDFDYQFLYGLRVLFSGLKATEWDRGTV